jgi:hypothetical protein
VNRTKFASVLRDAVVGALSEFRERVPNEVPYAFAIIQDECGEYLGYAIATEQGLQQVASKYDGKGYCYQGNDWEEFDNLEQLTKWLRWANPDDGWHYGNFPERFQVSEQLASLVRCGTFGKDAKELEAFCTDVLGSLQFDRDWTELVAKHRVIVGVTEGEDPRDFLRTASRANGHEAVRQLWAEYRRGEELSGRILPPDSRLPER